MHLLLLISTEKPNEKNGVEQVHVVYRKLKNGEAVVRNVKVQQNFGMQLRTYSHIKLISFSNVLIYI